ncbi:PPP4R2-domain-containing protein [Cokeromyces recurvatus]|uniref:PPP4R2-domain-containing protein n=1 Tax=Cokeromyces recurvatus TaxID=90255 RepID=UPI00222084AE|nr:PPP4R2-domain-containing protein [Cokeromyces recurvatus]KAI7906611.1 PPP4R2-domain-containing protein [Cokeromyces recurvatus]
MSIEEKLMLSSSSSGTASDTEETVSANENDAKPKDTVNNELFVEINDTLDDVTVDSVLFHIAKTNQLEISWKQLQKILVDLISKQHELMESKLTDKSVKKVADDLLIKITHAINDHLNCPFTIQRLCELVTEPKKYYKMYIKYLRAVEKVLLVNSYWEDFAHLNKEEQELSLDNNNNSLTLNRLDENSIIELEPHNFSSKTEESDDNKDQDEEKEEAMETETSLSEQTTIAANSMDIDI